MKRNPSLVFANTRFTIEPTLLFNWEDPTSLQAEYLKFVDCALDLILAQGLAVIVDIHPFDEIKLRLNSDPRQLKAFGRFWRWSQPAQSIESAAQHLLISLSGQRN